MKSIFTNIILLFAPLLLHAQYLTGIATAWSDSFVEWQLFSDEEEVMGNLKMRWPTRNDWTEWDYRLGDEFGTIKLKWKENPNEWEIRGDNQIVTARTVFANDFRQWRITDNSTRLTLQSKYGNRWDEWAIKEVTYGNFQIYTNWEGDPREWIIVDEFEDEISFPMKMAIVFIAVFHSSPKE